MEVRYIKELNENDLNRILELSCYKPHKETYTIQELDNSEREGDLFIDRDYQRNYIQTEKSASKFVESVFMGFIIPEIQLHNNKSTQKQEIIDGQQRVLSLIKFYRNEFPLSGLDYLSELNGYYFNELPKELQRIYKKFSLPARVVDRDDELKFLLFERLNTGSKQLNKQEIRNCVYRGKIMDLAKKLSENPIVKEVLLIPNDRFLLTELILQCLSVLYDKGVQKHNSVNKNINEFLLLSNIINEKDIIDLENNFLKSINLIKEYVSEDVYKRTNSIQKTIIMPLIIAVSFVSKRDFSKNIININNNLNTLINSEEFLMLSHCATTTRNNTNSRITLFKNAIGKSITDELILDDKRNFTPQEKNTLWNQIIKVNNKVVCALCGEIIKDITDSEVDHIIPHSKGGKTILSNGQLVHKTCNRLKNNNESL